MDVPIGLRERGSLERLCDITARNLLGKRATSVFPAPCRGALYAKSYGEAGTLNYELTGKRRLSRQSWGIIPKIKEVDDLLRQDETARRTIREIHPEVCFWALAGRPMEHPKRTEPGFWERKRVLQSAYGPTSDIVIGAFLAGRRGVASDDILDALAAAVTARLGRGQLKSIPEVPEHDSRGLPMEMVYYPKHPGLAGASPS